MTSPSFRDRRVLLFLVMLALFAAWLGVIAFWVFPYVARDLAKIDPMMALVAGLGIGGVTQFFVLVLKDGWQFFFRKSGPGSNGKSNQGGADAAPR